MVLAGLPVEIQEKLILCAIPKYLARLLSLSPHIKLLWYSRPCLRQSWLRLHARDGLTSSLDPTWRDAKLLLTASQVDLGWALQMYQSATLHRRVGLVERLLQDECSWPLAIQLAEYERQQDALMNDPSYGIYTRHLAWRFNLHQCPL